MPFYPAEDSRLMHANLRGLTARYVDLCEAFDRLPMRTVIGREHVWHGFLRRLRLIQRCVVNVFDVLPPEYEDIPPSEVVWDATINVQASISNLFGALDNLAWIWVWETGLNTNANGGIRKQNVGIGPKNKAIRSTFRQQLRDNLTGLEEWFLKLQDIRDAIAHQVPLYIPPYIVPPDFAEREADLQTRVWTTPQQDRRRLLAELQAIGEFKPLLIQSVFERRPAIAFHPQLLTDFQTLETIAFWIVEELEWFYSENEPTIPQVG